MKVTVLVWALKLAVPLTPPLTPVIVSGSPSGSLSLASSAELAMLSAVFWAAVKPLSFTATGGLSVPPPRGGCKHHIGPVIGGIEGVGREDAGGIGAAIGIHPVAAGSGAGRCRQGAAGNGSGEEIAGRNISASRVIRRDIGRIGADRNRRCQGNGLPTARSRYW